MKPAGLAHRRRAEKHYKPMLPLLSQMVKDDISYPEMAKQLNSLGLTTYRGTPFNTGTVFMLLKRCKSRNLFD